jgi:hypothetical protein
MHHLQFTKHEVTSDLNKQQPDGTAEIKQDYTARRGVNLVNDESKLNPEDISTNNHDFSYVVPFALFDETGRKYYEVSFRPKKEHQDGLNPYVKGANRCSGIMYIDAEQLYVFRLVAEMPESEGYSVAAFFGSINWFRTEILQEIRPDLNNLVVINSITTKLKYRYVIPHYYYQYKYTYSDYKYIP